jgi:transposase
MNRQDLKGAPPDCQTPEEFRELVGKLWTELDAALERIEELEERLEQNSKTSSKSPSTDTPKSRAERPKKRSTGKDKGAQPGHAKHERALVEESQLTSCERYYPDGQCGCGGELEMESEPSVRHQVFELPQVSYEVHEHQLFSGCCQRCRRRVTAQLPEWVPLGQMGPRLLSWIAVLNGQFHLTIRQMQRFFKVQWGLHFSIGAISEAQGKVIPFLGPLYRQVGRYVRRCPVGQADETRHARGGEQRWIWTLGFGVAVYFMTHFSRGKAAAKALLGSFSGVLVTDHYAGYNDYDRHMRQLCWAHRQRHFEAISRRKAEAGQIGARLVALTRGVFRTHHRVRDGTLDETRYQRRMARLRGAIQRQLEQGQRCDGSTRTANQCTHVLKDESMYWTFLRDRRIPMTNNYAERQQRSHVIWRKISFFSQSFRGEQFRPMILTVLKTAEQLQVNPVELLREAFEQGLRGGPITVRLPLPDPETLQLPHEK